MMPFQPNNFQIRSKFEITMSDMLHNASKFIRISLFTGLYADWIIMLGFGKTGLIGDFCHTLGENMSPNCL
jgi:hypothetical protein